MSSGANQEQEQKVHNRKQKAFLVQAAWSSVSSQKALLDGFDKRPLALQHLLANDFKQQDRYRDTEESIHHAQTLAKGSDRGEISVTYSREQNHDKPKGISVIPFMAIIVIFSLRMIFCSLKHEHPYDNISPPQKEQNKKNYSLSNRRHFPVLRAFVL